MIVIVAALENVIGGKTALLAGEKSRNLFSVGRMGTITLCYSNHRPEMLGQIEGIMMASETILLEEPPHPQFMAMLHGKASIEDLLLESDFDYPLFGRDYYRLLRRLHNKGKRLVQVEPYLEILLQIHSFFADGHGPEEIEPGGPMSAVYRAEKEATYYLIEYYKASRGGDFATVIETLLAFARSDASRFVLRDNLRAKAIAEGIDKDGTFCVETGQMHRYLYDCLNKNSIIGMVLRARYLENEIVAELGGSQKIFSPGDELTLAYIYDEALDREYEKSLAARALLYSKIVWKEELEAEAGVYPHLEDERWAIDLVNHFSYDDCEKIYPQLRNGSTLETRERIKRVLPEN